MVIAIAVFEKTILLGRDLRINFITADERRKILKIISISLFSKGS